MTTKKLQKKEIKITEGKMMLLPPAAHLCQECAVDHKPAEPHNAQSLFYQTKFNMENGRAATWLDAMSHCSEEVKKTWMMSLEHHGVDVKGGKIHPKQKK